MMMFIDANIFIESYKSGKKADESNSLLNRIKKGEQKAVTNPMVLDEVLYIMLRVAGQEMAIRTYRDILSLPNLRILSIDTRTTHIIPEYIQAGLMPHDAFHASTMKQNKITTICSYDKHFDKIKGIKRQEPK